MSCKHYRTRTKKGIKYGYCIKYKKGVPLFCKECNKIEYKEKKSLRSRTSKQAKREKERFSIIYSDLTKCCICGSTVGVEKNEIFEGAYRQTSIDYGMVAPMCYKETCHKRFHNDIMFNLFFKVMFQTEFMKTHSKEEFISIFKQDYIYKLEQKKRN